ncbi:MAG TPA: hypothetical protein V6D47_03310 [Oscillatoriaceae cyanobacterium]
MEALREYLKGQMVQLSDELLVWLGELLERDEFDRNNAEEMRVAYQMAHDKAMAELKEKQRPYYAVTFPQTNTKCPTCKEELRGAYWEISNPISCARGMFRVRLMHEFLEHGQPFYSEPIINMSETQLGVDEHHLDTKKLAKILAGLPVPQAVTDALSAGK